MSDAGTDPDEAALAEVLRAFGVSEPTIARAIERGDPISAFFEELPARGAAARSVTAAEIEASGGIPVAALLDLTEAFGLRVSGPDEPAFTPDEAAVFSELWELRDVWPYELSVQIGRVYGRLLARIAHASVQQWFAVVEPMLQTTKPDVRERTLTAAEAFERLLPLSDTLLAGIHRRWVEREAAQLAVRSAEQRRSELPGAVEVSILFCDLKDFTAFADRQGDGAAVRIIDALAAVVTREAGPQSRLTKLIGDGFMLAYPEPRLAVQAGARIIDAMRTPDLPGVHASVHHGRAIPREGDYFGSAVNLAARLLISAGRDELVATRSVVERTREFAWRPAGGARFKGLSDEVEVFTLAWTHDG